MRRNPPDTSTVAVRALKLQMGSTPDVIAVKSGSYLVWHLDTTLLHCHAELPADSLPDEFFELLASSSNTKVIGPATLRTPG